MLNTQYISPQNMAFIRVLKEKKQQRTGEKVYIKDMVNEVIEAGLKVYEAQGGVQERGKGDGSKI